MTGRERVVRALAGLDLLPSSSLRLTDRAAERVADAALDALAAGPVEQLQPAAEVAAEIARDLGVGTAPVPTVDRLRYRIEVDRRDAIGVTYAEGREDRDRLRRERDEALDALADVLGALDRLGLEGLNDDGQGGRSYPGAVAYAPPTLFALRDAGRRARRYLDRASR